ncbi:hypothetical protein KP78_07700 [Jeotgalibacillus soli]|uniref:Uncharacterized protein n=1 Tax=Jeotgalibacillus soli TaxID=889306 RepID=A0A0C2VK61_9BACL|nr:hypothetical protein KP78_07700 [Jeotgalibacillus soli]
MRIAIVLHSVKRLLVRNDKKPLLFPTRLQPSKLSSVPVSYKL